MQQLHPRAVWLFFIGSFISWAVAAYMLSALFGIFQIMRWANQNSDSTDLVFVDNYFTLWSWAIFIVVVIIAYTWARLSYHYYRYELVEKGFRKESGVIWKRYVTIPYDRIQNVDIYRGLIARLLGLSDLHIHTAGVGGIPMGEGRLPGLSREVAEQMRDELIDRARQSRSGQGL